MNLLCRITAVVLVAFIGRSASAGSRATKQERSLERPHPLLTGYFPQWGLYNEQPYTVKTLVDNGGAARLDQLNYAQAFVTDGHCSIADPKADLNYTFSAGQSVNGVADNPDRPFRGNLHQIAELKRLYPHLKVVISLEGKSSSFSGDAQPENREAFVNSCIDLFIQGNLAPGIHEPHLFDGIDIDWEYPQQQDAANYIALLKLFREKMDAVRPGLLLNIAAGVSPRMYAGTDMREVAGIVNEVGLMTYDFNGPWDDTTGFIAPLRAGQDYDGGTVERTVRAYLDAGVPASKLLVGIPFYGYGWRQVEDNNNGLFQEGVAIRGDRPYRTIAALEPQSTVYRDKLSQAPWLFDGDAFWTFEDPVSIRHKTEYMLQQHLGGLMIWELGEDAPNGLLLQAAYDAIRAPIAGDAAALSLRPAGIAAPEVRH